MSTIPFGGTIHRELLSLSKTIEQERAEESDQTNDFSRLLAEKSGVFRLHLNLYLDLFSLLEQLDERWRTGILRGEVGFDLGQEADIRNLFELWVYLSDPMRQRMEYYARHTLNPMPDPARSLAESTRKANEVLASWQSPTLARCKALRVRYVTPEEAERLDLPAK